MVAAAGEIENERERREIEDDEKGEIENEGSKGGGGYIQTKWVLKFFLT